MEACTIILEMGEGTCLTEGAVHILPGEVAKIADSIGFSRKRIVIKAELFDWEPPNEPLDIDVFARLHRVCTDLGFPCTASVFDRPSLERLLGFKIPFVKIANRTYLRRLAILVPRGIEVYASYSMDPADETEYDKYVDYWMACVSDYPAEMEDYDRFRLSPNVRPLGISDHTVGLDLYRKYRPDIYEKHFGLKGTKGPSLGPWSIDEDGLVELLRLVKGAE